MNHRREEGWVLGITTVTRALGLAIGPLGEAEGLTPLRQAWVLDRQMAAQVHPCLQAFIPPHLGWDTCVAVGVAVGPGSFTGCRLGVTVARTLGQTLGIPVYGYSSLAALAWGQVEGQEQVAVGLDAKRGEWFGGIYVSQGSRVEVVVPEQLWPLPQWQAAVAGFPPRAVLTVDDDTPADRLAGHLVALARQDWALQQPGPWAAVIPVYSRQPPIGAS